MPKLPPRIAERLVPGRVETTLDAALDRALAVQRPVVLAYLERVRAKNPAMTPDELVRQLENRYRAGVAMRGGRLLTREVDVEPPVASPRCVRQNS